MRYIYLFFIAIAFLVIIPNAYSEIKHISLNERMFEIGKVPILKINIVADQQHIPNLEFVLVQKNSEERLVVRQQNQFILVVMGQEKVYDINAKLIVRYSNPIGSIPLFNEIDYVEEANASSSGYPMQITPNSNSCTLEYDGDKTLWRLAKDYSAIWKTNVYSAMLAVFYANPDGFYQGKINGLRKNAKLSCPSEELLNYYRDNQNAKNIFDSLNSSR